MPSVSSPVPCPLVASPSPDPDSVKRSEIPTVLLRKRTVSSDRDSLGLPCVTSAFLTGLFADVENAVQEAPPDVKTLNIAIAEPDIKRQRTCLLGRSTKSLHLLAEAFGETSEVSRDLISRAIDEGCKGFETPTTSALVLIHGDRADSLHEQLHCISVNSETSCENYKIDTKDTVELAFPNLPSAVSETSLTRLGQQSPTADTPNKESYGWFVEMEDDNTPGCAQQVDPYAKTSSAALAFQAPTAPKASDYDAELQWAAAADTVDDVLGDFF